MASGNVKMWYNLGHRHPCSLRRRRTRRGTKGFITTDAEYIVNLVNVSMTVVVNVQQYSSLHMLYLHSDVFPTDRPIIGCDRLKFS